MKRDGDMWGRGSGKQKRMGSPLTTSRTDLGSAKASIIYSVGFCCSILVKIETGGGRCMLVILVSGGVVIAIAS